MTPLTEYLITLTLLSIVGAVALVWIAINDTDEEEES